MFLFGNDLLLFGNDMFLFGNDLFLFGNDLDIHAGGRGTCMRGEGNMHAVGDDYRGDRHSGGNSFLRVPLVVF